MPQYPVDRREGKARLCGRPTATVTPERMSFQIAHAGHWLVNIAYFLPVVAFIGWLVITQIRERRRGRG